MKNKIIKWQQQQEHQQTTVATAAARKMARLHANYGRTVP